VSRTTCSTPSVRARPTASSRSPDGVVGDTVVSATQARAQHGGCLVQQEARIDAAEESDQDRVERPEELAQDA
jgi:hypothetical protein